ncbi:MAG: Nif3-like dinuclear metal center hexameric protein [Bacteroidales bacterium]|nr:Nif3-like dinuclear metal center hexameric protein [Bacteroidales bacterium]
MKVKDITAVLEAFAPLRVQEDWDNSGLLIGSPEDEVHGLLAGFDCTPELIREAIEKGCDMVVTHHPLIFHGLKHIGTEDPVGLAVTLAIRNGIAVYAAHTSADKVPAGVSGAMARRLGLQDIEILIPDADSASGLGCMGYFPIPMTGMEALQYVKEKFGLKLIRCSKPLETPIERVALLGGGGGSETEAARNRGAQLYITADVPYHHFFAPEGFMVMDIGHFESEVEIVDIFLSQIRKNFPTFASYKSAALDRSNPVHYFVM